MKIICAFAWAMALFFALMAGVILGGYWQNQGTINVGNDGGQIMTVIICMFLSIVVSGVELVTFGIAYGPKRNGVK